MGIIAYDVEKALRAFGQGADPLELSIAKWEAITAVLMRLEDELHDKCGLCFKYGANECRDCPLNGKEDTCCTEDQEACLEAATSSAQRMLRRLKNLRKKSGEP